MELLERQIACGGDLLPANDDVALEMAACSVPGQSSRTPTLTRSPPCSNLDDIPQMVADESPAVCVAQEPAFQCESSPLFDV